MHKWNPKQGTTVPAGLEDRNRYVHPHPDFPDKDVEVMSNSLQIWQNWARYLDQVPNNNN